MRADSIDVYTGNANPELAAKIARYLGRQIGKAEVFAFANENIFVKILDNAREKDVFIVQPTSRPVSTSIMELLIMIDALRRASAARITAVIPFFGYARQDRKDKPRVPITAKLVANLLTAAGANRVLTVDLHAQQIQGFFDHAAQGVAHQNVGFLYAGGHGAGDDDGHVAQVFELATVAAQQTQHADVGAAGFLHRTNHVARVARG